MRRRALRALGAAAALCVLASAPLGAEPAARLLSSYTWRLPDLLFGGYSALELSGDGTRLTAISDRGSAITAVIERRGDTITGLRDAQITVLGDTKGQPMMTDGPTNSGKRDSEGLALAPDGSLYVSFEGEARVWRYTDFTRAEALPVPRAFRGLQRNSSLEALAVDRRGWLYTLPERSGDLKRPFPVYRHRNGIWDQPFSIPRIGGFLAVGADIGPDGRLYLLEREFTGMAFRTQVRRFDLGEGGVGDGVILLNTRPGRFDNLEGISVWRDGQGTLRMTLISDDNFRFFQRTQLVEFALPE